jgi:hypothetical protein
MAGAGHLVPLEASGDLNSRIISFLEAHRVVTVPPETLASYVGRYEIWGSTAEVAFRDGRLTLTLPAEKELPLFASSETKFFMIIWGETEIEFTKGAAGITGFQFRQGGQTQTAKRLSSG